MSEREPNNLWGDLPLKPSFRMPAQILKEQADILTRATNGVLVGVVRPMQNSDTDFVFRLSIRAPALNNYHFVVLKVEHNVNPYPLSVALFDRDEETFIECRNEDEFIQLLQSILQKARVRNAISGLMAQSDVANSATDE